MQTKSLYRHREWFQSFLPALNQDIASLDITTNSQQAGPSFPWLDHRHCRSLTEKTTKGPTLGARSPSESETSFSFYLLLRPGEGASFRTRRPKKASTRLCTTAYVNLASCGNLHDKASFFTHSLQVRDVNRAALPDQTMALLESLSQSVALGNT